MRYGSRIGTVPYGTVRYGTGTGTGHGKVAVSVITYQINNLVRYPREYPILIPYPTYGTVYCRIGTVPYRSRTVRYRTYTVRRYSTTVRYRTRAVQ